MALASMTKPVRKWLEERLPVEKSEEFARKQAGKLLPSNVSWWHTFGSLALFLMVNQIVTGILLMVYYRATGDAAFESVKFIMTKTWLGWLIRGLHSWGANLMVLALILHMFRTFMMGSFKKPRELTWVVGVILFGVTLTFGFTGYLLPWNQVSYWATTVGTEVAGAVPLFGGFVKYLLRGGEAVGEETLARFYAMHVTVLPWVLVGLVALHLFLMRLQGLSPMEPVGEETPLTKENGIPFFPNHVLKEMVVFPWFFLILISIVILFPPELGEKADPFVTPEGIKPEWYFLPTYQLLKYFPKLLGITVSMAPMAVLFLWPFLDRSKYRRPRHRPVSFAVGLSGLLLALVFGFLGHISERKITVMGRAYHVDLYGIPHPLEKVEGGAGQEDEAEQEGKPGREAAAQE